MDSESNSGGKMKKIILLTAAFLLIAAGAVFSAGLNVSHKAGNYEVTLTTDKNPLIVGDNPATVSIKEASGKTVTDASVELYYFMPSMKAMNYTSKAVSGASGYTAVINPTMAGEWNVDVKITKQGEKAHKTSFTFKAE
jgi:hypothetical protein